MRRTTIRDVAALAGVSPATVSRALDDRPEIRPETRERVREACRQLGYVPNAAAKGLAGQATHVLGVVDERRYDEEMKKFDRLVRDITKAVILPRPME